MGSLLARLQYLMYIQTPASTRRLDVYVAPLAGQYTQPAYPRAHRSRVCRATIEYDNQAKSKVGSESGNKERDADR